jgi:hypothetical protein
MKRKIDNPEHQSLAKDLITPYLSTPYLSTHK